MLLTPANAIVSFGDSIWCTNTCDRWECGYFWILLVNSLRRCDFAGICMHSWWLYNFSGDKDRLHYCYTDFCGMKRFSIWLWICSFETTEWSCWTMLGSSGNQLLKIVGSWIFGFVLSSACEAFGRGGCFFKSSSFRNRQADHRFTVTTSWKNDVADSSLWCLGV